MIYNLLQAPFFILTSRLTSLNRAQKLFTRAKFYFEMWGIIVI